MQTNQKTQAERKQVHQADIYRALARAWPEPGAAGSCRELQGAACPEIGPKALPPRLSIC